MLPYRVLDLSDERGQLCGRLLADLGADVVLVEPPGGSASRRCGPFAGDVEDPERSLFHWAYNRGKRSAVLDLEDPADRQVLLALVRTTDVLVEDRGTDALATLGLGREVLEAENPRLVHASITAFGCDGPKAGWAATDLTVAASSGAMSLTGDEDRPPLRVGVPQAFHHAAADAAGAVMAALFERDRTSGRGQHIDLSAQQSHSVASQSFLLSHPGRSGAASRTAGGVRMGGLDTKVQLLWPCKDGQVSVTFLFGASMGPFTRNLMAWICEEGFCDEATRDKDWIDYGTMLYDGREPISEYERLKGILHDFFMTKTKAELFAATFARRVLIAPVTTTEELVHSEHHRARGYWQAVDVGELCGEVGDGSGEVTFPGAFAQLSTAPLAVHGRPARLGEHTAAVRAEARTTGTVRAEATAAAGGVRPSGTGRGPLAGLKVADFMWVFAGPYCSRMLTDLGATVVRVESAHHLDTLRTAGNFQDDKTDVEWDLQFGNVNAGKLGLALDLGKPEARQVAIDLVRWADVTMESFTPKTMASWGLDYESLRVHRPDLVMTSSCLMGHYGPQCGLAGFGTMAAAVSGWFSVTGWPDRLPCGPFGAYTDYVAPRFLLVATLAALEHRRRTGEGCYVDLSQAEASAHLLAPAVLDYTVNGRVMDRVGNDDRVFAPHGVYPAAGDDRWVAIAVTDDGAWRALCSELDRSDLAGLSAVERRARRRELDEVVAAWTAGQDAAAAMQRLQAVGVAAHQVQNTVEAFEDPQLGHRGHFVEVPHSAMGTTWVEAGRLRFSRTPTVVDRGAPTIGEHSWQVLTELLGYDPDRAAELAVIGAVE